MHQRFYTFGLPCCRCALSRFRKSPPLLLFAASCSALSRYISRYIHPEFSSHCIALLGSSVSTFVLALCRWLAALSLRSLALSQATTAAACSSVVRLSFGIYLDIYLLCQLLALSFRSLYVLRLHRLPGTLFDTVLRTHTPPCTHRLLTRLFK